MFSNLRLVRNAWWTGEVGGGVVVNIKLLYRKPELMHSFVPEICCFTHHTQVQALRSHIPIEVKTPLVGTLHKNCIPDKRMGSRCHPVRPEPAKANYRPRLD